LDAVIIHHASQRSGSASDIKRAIKGPWAILEILNRLLSHKRPWYLADERLACRLCPYSCGAVVIVIESELSALRWPLTEGGLEIQAAARMQTEKWLQSYLDDLLSNPRERLPGPAAQRPGWTAPDVGGGM